MNVQSTFSFIEINFGKRFLDGNVTVVGNKFVWKSENEGHS